MHGIISFVANYGLVLSVLGVLVTWLLLDSTSDRKRFILQALIGGVLVILIARLGSWLFYDPRPFVAGHFAPYFSHSNNNGFPSDHTLFTSYIAFLVLYYNRKLGVTLLLVAAVIGLARVFAGVHHLIDIVGAFVITGTSSAIAYSIIKALENRGSKV